ncbi:MAG: glycosyltransferase [Firmicutes bacterium]|nr:glycosyltransferase [Bacillota bacterium]
MIPEIEYMTCYLDGRLGRAKEILRKLIAEHPDYAAFHADLALVYLQQWEIAEAREAAEKARALVASGNDATPPGEELSSDTSSSNMSSGGSVPARPGILAAVGFVRERIGDHEGALSLYEEAKSATSSMGRRRLWIDYAIERVKKRLSGHEGLEEDKEGQNDSRPRHVQAQLRISYFLDPNLGPDALRLVCEHMNRLIARGHKVYAIARVDKLDGLLAEIIRVPAREELYERTPDSDIVVATSWRTAFDAARVPGAAPFYLVQPSPCLEPKRGLAEGSGAESADQASKNLEASFRLPLRLIASSDYVRSVLKARYNRKADVVPYGVDLNMAPSFPGRVVRADSISGTSSMPGAKGQTNGSTAMVPDPSMQEVGKLQSAKDRLTRLLVVGSDEDEWMENIYAALRLIVERRQNEVEVVRVSSSRRLDFSFHVATWVENPDSSQLARIFSDCDVFITGSPEGIFSQGALTAMAYGLPVVLCAREEGISSYMGKEIASHKEEIASHTDGEERTRISNLATGHDIAEGYTESAPYLLVLLNDAEAIARAIETLIDDEDLRKKVGSNGQEIVKAHTWDRAIDQLEGLLLAAVTDVQLAYPSAAALGVTPATGRGMGGDRVTFESSPHESVSQASRLSPRRRPTLSLCMIVKNEERFLARCLDSVKDVVDEMIIVDTGSTDRTVEIAKSYGAKVYFHEWKNDFAEARNASLEKATGDWILVMDADEVLVPSSVEELYRLAAAEPKAVYCARIVNETGWDDNQGEGYGFEHYMARFFPNEPGIKYHGAVHERIVPEPGAEVPILAASGIIIRHAGYRNDISLGRTKRLRNLELLEKTVKDYPDHPFYRYSLGGAYYEAGRLRSALEQLQIGYETALKWPDELFSRGIVVAILQLMSTISDGLEESDLPKRYLEHALAIEPNNPDTLFALGEFYKKTGDFEKAIDFYNKAAEPGSRQFVGMSHNPSTNTWGPRLGLCATYCAMQEWDKARNELVTGIRLFGNDKEFVTACRRLSKIIGKENNPEAGRIDSCLKEFLSQHESANNHVLSSPVDGLRKVESNSQQPLQLDERAMPISQDGPESSITLMGGKHGDSNEETLKAAATAYDMGNYTEAIALYGRVLDIDNVGSPDLYLRYGRALKMAGYKREALPVLLKALNYQPNDLILIQELIDLTAELKAQVSL